jgi:membrane protein YqaA with SNARE-associated domain
VTHDLLAMLGIYGGSFVVSIIAGLIPVVNTELFLVGLVRFGVDRPAQLPGIVIASAVGQMVAKVGLYYAGQELLELPRGRYRAKIETVRRKIEQWRTKPYLVYAISAVVGLPPLYLTVLAAGAMKIRFIPFLVIGLAGRLLRFSVIVALAWAA